MIKVLNVLLDNHIGGPQIRVLSVADELKKFGIETIILSPRGEGDFAWMARKKGFKVYQIKLCSPKHLNTFNSIFANIMWFLTFPFLVITIARIIRKENIDIVHTNGLINLQAPVAAFITRTKIVWYLSSSLFPKTVVSLIMPFVKMASNRIVITSKRLEKYYFGDVTNYLNLAIIHECIDVRMFNPSSIQESDIQKLKKELNIKPHEKVIGCIGNVNPTKGYEFLISSVGQITKEYKDIKVIIVGAILDTQKTYYKKLQTIVSLLDLKQNIIFIGKRDNISQILSIFDVFILSSVSEGGPRVTLEAMAMEKAVIATDVGAVPEQIIIGETGFVVPIMNPRALSDACIYFLKDTKDKIRMGKKGRERVKETFSLDRCVKEHKIVYEECL